MYTSSSYYYASSGANFNLKLYRTPSSIITRPVNPPLASAPALVRSITSDWLHFRLYLYCSVSSSVLYSYGLIFRHIRSWLRQDVLRILACQYKQNTFTFMHRHSLRSTTTSSSSYHNPWIRKSMHWLQPRHQRWNRVLNPAGNGNHGLPESAV